MLGAKPDKLTRFSVAITEMRLLPASRAAFERRGLWLWLFEEFIRRRTDASATLLIFFTGAIPRRPKLGRDLVVAAALANQRLKVRLAKLVVGNDRFVAHRAAPVVRTGGASAG